MPLFTLPLPPSSTAPTSRTHLSSLPPRKRKRSPSPTPSLTSEKELPTHPDASTNPLALTPAEIAQYRLAGLSLDRELPAHTYKNFPHRAIPDPTPSFFSKGKGKGKAHDREKHKEREIEIEEEENDRENRSHRKTRLRTQHLSVIVAILQRKLLERDIPRASRAWALLVRTQVNGQAIDLRGSGYWGIGAELLIRSMDRAQSRDAEDGSDVKEKRWGTREGLDKAKDYYERLILEHPYKRQFHGSVNALDFWPAMVGCEIYGIQWEHREGLWRVYQNEQNDGEGDGSGVGSASASDADMEEDEDEDPATAQQRRIISRQEIRANQYSQKRDAIRRTALEASEKVAARLDELMTAPPYSDSHVLLRLRGMLALYIGDLSVPTPPSGGDNTDEDMETLDRNHRLGLGGRETERRIKYREKVTEYRRGEVKRTQERARAIALFDKIRRDGGDVKIDLDSLAVESPRGELYDMDD